MSRTRLRTKVYGKWIVARRRFPTNELEEFDVGLDGLIDMEDVYLALHFPKLFGENVINKVGNLFRTAGQ